MGRHDVKEHGQEQNGTIDVLQISGGYDKEDILTTNDAMDELEQGIPNEGAKGAVEGY